jgi:hypothetical protein
VNGAALPRDTSAIVAEQLRAVLARDEAVSARRASIAVLERLTGRTIAEPSVFALPTLALEVARSRDEGRVEALRARPEFAQFARTRERLEREAALTHVENRPRVLAFGQGAGRRDSTSSHRSRRVLAGGAPSSGASTRAAPTAPPSRCGCNSAS